MFSWQITRPGQLTILCGLITLVGALTVYMESKWELTRGLELRGLGRGGKELGNGELDTK